MSSRGVFVEMSMAHKYTKHDIHRFADFAAAVVWAAAVVLMILLGERLVPVQRHP